MSGPEPPPFELGYPRTEVRRQLIDAVLRGDKTATAGLVDDYVREREPIPRVGDRYTLHDYDDTAVGIVEITEARVIPANDVDVQFSRDEGEGFETVEDWRKAHERFFDRTIADDTPIVALRFRVVRDG